MAGVADSAVGAILEIPPQALQSIKNAEAAIKSLQATSATAAQKIKGHFDNTAVSGLNAFIKKVEDAKNRLGNVKMPTIDATGFATSISQIAQAMATVDKSATTGATRIGRIADSITKLSAAHPSAQMFQTIANGITAIGNTSQQTIQNVSQLAQTMAQLARDIRTVQNAQRAQSDGTASASQYNKLYKEQADLIRQMNVIKEKGNSATAQELSLLRSMGARYAEINDQLNKLNQKKQTAASTLAQNLGNQRVGNAIDRTTVSGAIDYARQAKSLRELQDAYKNLKTVMATVDPKSAAWQQMNVVLQQTKSKIDSIRNAMGEFQNQSRLTVDSLGKLKGQLATAFSVAAITGYIRKMVEVRSEFELQNVALRAILQNKDEADRIFVQVQQMALQSPFNIMELNTYTKQLAAYRIESEKLVGTTKMLADVSAGLGVDMGRLILAYGQVKSANYLRATEIRQFTEAGLNIAGELAQYFSELQGKMVSVGDVMEMVTKRMVRFEDVEEVFKRVTSAGGLFYDMQKKQSETLQGQILRIKDAIDIMFNDIGKTNQGTISSALKIIRELVSHWREVWLAIKTAAIGLGTFVVTTRLLRGLGVTSVKELGTGFSLLVGQIRTATSATAILNGALKGLMSSTGIGLIVAAVATLIGYLWQAHEAASALQDELGRIGAESFNQMNESIGRFVELANVITDSNKTYTEHQEALDELHRTYGEIIPQQKLQSDYIQGLNGDYRELIDTISEYYQQQEYNNKVEAITSSDKYEEVVEEAKKAGEEMMKVGMFDPNITKAQVDAWMEVIAKELATGKLKNNVISIGKRMRQIFGDTLYSTSEYTTGSYFIDTSEKVEELRDKIDNLAISTINAADNQEVLDNALKNMSYESISDQIDGIHDKIKTLNEEIALQRERMQNFQAVGDTQMVAFSEEQIARKEEQIRRLVQAEENYNAILAERQGMAIAQQIEEGTDAINKQVIAYYNLNKRYYELKESGRLTAEAEAELKKQMDDAYKSASDLAYGLGFKLERSTLDAMDSEYALGETTKDIAEKAFPVLAQRAISAMNEVQIALLKGERGFAKFKQAINRLTDKLGFTVFDDQTQTIEQLNAQIDALAKGASKATQKVDESAKAAQEVRNTIAEKYKVRASDLDIKRGADENDKMFAANIRKQAQEGIKAWKDYNAAVEAGRKELNGKINGYTKQEIEHLKKVSDAQLEYADSIYTEAEKERKSSARSGKDPMLEIWKNRLDALKRYYDAAEKARKHLSESETKVQQTTSFENLWYELGFDKVKGLDLNTLLSQGFNPDLLKDNYVEALKRLRDAIPPKYAELKKDIEKVIASESIEIQFKIKEKEADQLKKQLDDMFASYELTEELKKIGVNVDLTYMVGGKPTTLEDIRNEIERLRKEGGGKADAENRIKILEEAEKKITQIELKEQKERLKNYEKYLKKAYSDSAKVQLEYFVKLQQMQEDFAKAEKDLKEQLANPQTSAEDKLKIQKALENLPNQASRAAKGMREEMEKELDKLNLDKLLKSPLFAEMFQDLGSMTNKVLDTMLDKIRDIQKSANDLSLSQIRQLAQYAEKIENAKLDNSPFKEAYNAIKKAYELRAKGITAKSASDALAVSEEELERLQTLKNDISLILGIKEKSYQIDNDMVTVGDTQHKLTAQQKTLLDKNTSELNEQLDILEDQSGELDGSIKKQKQVVTINAQTVQVFKNALTATEKLSNALKKAAEAGKVAIDAVTNGMQMFGKEVSEADQVWLDFTKDMMDAGVELAIMFLALGATINNALGIIGIISTALTFVAGLFKAIFQSHDKRLQKQIENLQDRTDTLSKSFEKLQKSIERAFSISSENRLTEQALDNLEEQKRAYQEMIRLEEAKKKTDDDKIKDYKDKLEELAEAEEELYEKKHEKYGSTNDVWSEANNWVDAWLDAYKETGDGLDALNESWDEFYENLVKKQAASKVLGARMDSWVKQINDAIDKNMGSEYDYIDLFKQIGDKMKEEFDATNKDLKKIFEYAGIGGGAGELILSDLQKGIQNITEPQAAAIEAYLNSMRGAVWHHTEQLDTLIATIQAQYGSGAENPVVTELKGIKRVLDNINSTLQSVIKTEAGNTFVHVG